MTVQFRIDLDLFARNLHTIRERVAPAEHMLVVKDDAYRHGVAEIVQRAVAEGVTWIGALDVVTGTAVRRAAGGDVRVFAWMIADADDVADALAADLDLGVGTAALLDDVAAVARRDGRVARVHLKIDTGLHRNGVRPEQWPDFVGRAAELERAGLIVVIGIWSHIAEASDAEDDAARAAFDAAVVEARAAGLAPTKLHLAASAAAFARAEFRYDMVRIGAFAYGIRSTDGPSDDELGISPIGALRAQVVALAPDDAVIGVGSAHGLLSSVKGALHVATPVGRAVVTEIGTEILRVRRWDGAAVGDVVTVFGADGADSATDVAERIDTIGEELVLRLSPEIPRTYH